MINLIERAAHDLQELSIPAPNGTRRISEGEASSLMKFLRDSAEKVIEQAKQRK